MQVSAEVRWFWPDLPTELDEWFRRSASHPFPAGGGKQRNDDYLVDPDQTELGLKRRGQKLGVEVKGLVVKEWASLNVRPFSGIIELWTKWTTQKLELRSTTTIRKARWLRKFDMTSQSPEEVPLDDSELLLHSRVLPAYGCNVEFTKVTLPGNQVWWTLGFESFGPISTLERSLCAAATTLAGRHPPELGPACKVGILLWPNGTGALIASYPVWLRERSYSPTEVK